MARLRGQGSVGAVVGISRCSHVGGRHRAIAVADFDVLVLVRAPDNAALRDLVLDRIQSIPGVRTTRTWLVFDELQGPGADWS